MILIGISGRKRSGKDTCADAITFALYEFGGLENKKAAFASEVRAATERAFNFLGIKFSNMVESQKEKTRPLLQGVGTHAGRRYDPDIWVKALFEGRYINAKETGVDAFIITDVRFPNEVQAILDRGGYIIRLTRHPHPEDRDESETALDEWEENGFRQSDWIQTEGWYRWTRRPDGMVYMLYNHDLKIDEQRAAAREIAKDILQREEK